jgi:hypothetical protein
MNMKSWILSFVLAACSSLGFAAVVQAASADLVMQKVVLSTADATQIEHLLTVAESEIVALQDAEPSAQWEDVAGHAAVGAALGLIADRIKHSLFRAGFGRELACSDSWVYSASAGAIFGTMLALAAYVDSKPVIKQPLLKKGIVREQVVFAVVESLVDCLTIATKEACFADGSGSRPLPANLVGWPTRWLKEILLLVVAIDKVTSIIGDRIELGQERNDLMVLKARLQAAMKKLQEQSAQAQLDVAIPAVGQIA